VREGETVWEEEEEGDSLRKEEEDVEGCCGDGVRAGEAGNEKENGEAGEVGCERGRNTKPSGKEEEAVWEQGREPKPSGEEVAQEDNRVYEEEVAAARSDNDRYDLQEAADEKVLGNEEETEERGGEEEGEDVKGEEKE
jgi:hypothetical protein